jgi:hypothetical protein
MEKMSSLSLVLRRLFRGFSSPICSYKGGMIAIKLAALSKARGKEEFFGMMNL